MPKVIIIGAGPAGVSAAVYLKRYNIPSLVIENGASNLLLAKEIENYYGIDSISGKDLYESGLKKLEQFEIEVVKDNVLSINYESEYVIKTEGNQYRAEYLVLACGLAKNNFNVKGIKDVEGRGVSYCATCDGFFYRRKELAIIGYNSYMEEELAVLNNLTDKITIFTNANQYENKAHEVILDKILELKKIDNKVVIVTEKGEYQFDGVFVAYNNYNSFSISKHLGLSINEKNEIIVNQNYETNYPRCYAIGDMIPDIKQVGVAVSHGIHVAKNIFDKEKEVK